MQRDPREPENNFARITSGFHDQEIGRLKRYIERLRQELECYRERFPGFVYVPEQGRLMDSEMPEECGLPNPLPGPWDDVEGL